MAGIRNLHRIDLYCPEYMTNATILIDKNHYSDQPHLVAHYEMGGLKGQMQFAAVIPAHRGDDDLIELIFLPLEKRENRNYPTWEVPTRDHGSASSFGSARRRSGRAFLQHQDDDVVDALQLTHAVTVSDAGFHRVSGSPPPNFSKSL